VSSGPARRRGGQTALAGVLAAALLTSGAPAPAASPILYPDLRTAAISFEDLELRGGSTPTARVRLTFDNAVQNHGEGPVELRDVRRDGSTDVYQWLRKKTGHYANRLAGRFVYHPGHGHTHFGDFADYEVWDREAFNAWVAGGRVDGAPLKRSTKVSYCLLDVQEFAFSGVAAPRTYVRCDARVQGISVGWEDVYTRDLPDQDVVLGHGGLPDGGYLLRSVVDPRNRLWESPQGADPAREGPEANEALVEFDIAGGQLREPAP